jgi:cell division protease FtsH
MTVVEPWLPIGQKLPEGGRTKRALYEGNGWQVVETEDKGSSLISAPELAERWVRAGLADDQMLPVLTFGKKRFMTCWSGHTHVLAPITQCRSPRNSAEAMAFATSLKTTREIDPESPLQDAIYVERFSRLLPTYSITSRTPDDVILGFWLTGGAQVSAKSFRRLRQMLSWLDSEHLEATVKAAGFTISEVMARSSRSRPRAQADTLAQTAEGEPATSKDESFALPGRPELEKFFNEHVVDIIKNQSKYQAFGIGFPSAIVLHGPPGCGKTFAVERLVEFLGWPSFQIEASTVASPYIHDTSKKVAAVFQKAMENAPSVLVIDEMEAFLADRQMGAGSSHHRVEEVGEFLRRIPEATKNRVLIVAMTNRIEMIDPAILRRGRFDHVINVPMASEEEVRALLTSLLAELPSGGDVDIAAIAKQLTKRPLSDVAFAVREAARLAVRAGKPVIDHASFLYALGATPARGEEESPKRIGFV